MPEPLELSEKAEYLRQLLAEWMHLYSEASRHFPQDGDAYYLEQTLSALLVAAGWKIGVPGVTEARIRRRDGPRTRGGRADVLLKFGTTVTAIEAKIHWFNDSGGFDKVMQLFRDARVEAASIVGSASQLRMGLCFGVVERGPLPTPALMEESVSRARSEPWDVLAYAVTSSMREDSRYRGYILLGGFVE